jgi:hypothetical protein
MVKAITIFERRESALLALRALRMLAAEYESSELVFETDQLAQLMNQLATKDSSEAAATINARKCGWLLRHLGLQKATAGRTKRRWRLTVGELNALADSYNLEAFEEPELNKNAASSNRQAAVAGVVKAPDPVLSELIEWYLETLPRLPREPLWLSSWCFLGSTAQVSEFFDRCRELCEASKAGCNTAENDEWLKRYLNPLRELFGER